MRRRVTPIVCMVIVGYIVSFEACERGRHERSTQQVPRSFNVVATVLPVENLALAITAGSKYLNVVGLLPSSGGCPHDYTLTPGDLRKLEHADMVVAVGLGYEPFLEKIKEHCQGGQRSIRIVLAGEAVEKLISAPKEKGQPRREVNQDKHIEQDDHHRESTKTGTRSIISQEHNHDKDGSLNDHPFVSPKQAAVMARTIATALVHLDPEETDLLRSNEEGLVKELESIHVDMMAFVARLENKRVAAVSPVFGHLVRDIGLEQVAVLTSRHLEPLSAGRLAEVIEQLQHNRPALILNEDQFDERIARSLGEATGVKVINVGTQTTGPRGPTAFVEQARAIKDALEGGLGERRHKTDLPG